MQIKHLGVTLLLNMAALCFGLSHASAQSEADAARLFPFPVHQLNAQQVPGTVNPAEFGDSLWLSPHQVINVKDGTLDLVTYDVETGRPVPLDFINALAPDQKDYNDLTATRTSPDGRWLLWPSGSNEKPTWTAMSPDGTQRRQWPRATFGPDLDVAWMQDNRHWVQLSDETMEVDTSHRWFRPLLHKVRVYDTESPEIKEFPLILNPTDHIEILPRQGRGTQFAFTQDGRAWLSTLSSGSCQLPNFPLSCSFLDSYELVPGLEAWKLCRSTTTLGSDDEAGSSDECVRSPDDNWLIWRNYAKNGRGPLRLVLTDIDGSNPQIIRLSSERKEMSNIQWAADSQHVAFWDHSGLGTTGIFRITLTNLEANLHKPRPHSLIADHLSTTGKFPVAVTQAQVASKLPQAVQLSHK